MDVTKTLRKRNHHLWTRQQEEEEEQEKEEEEEEEEDAEETSTSRFEMLKMLKRRHAPPADPSGTLHKCTPFLDSFITCVFDRFAIDCLIIFRFCST